MKNKLNYYYQAFTVNDPDATGNQSSPENFHYEQVPFDKYEIKIRLSEDNKFLGVQEVRVNKDFISNKLKSLPKGYHDVEEYYAE